MLDATICPTITADNPHTYRAQIERATAFAGRIHIDVADGTLAPSRLLPLEQIWWPSNVTADVHVMIRRPLDKLELLVSLHPQLVIVHAEADGEYAEFARAMKGAGIETGVALLQTTPVSLIASSLDMIDHVLVFSGNFGHFGGQADLGLLDKVRQLRALKPSLEIGWDGGVSDLNASQLTEAGVDVLNVGGFIQRSPDPVAAYEQLVRKLHN